MIGDSDRREQWLRASQDITGALLSGDDPRAALRVVAERARLLADAPIAVIAVPDEDNAANLIFDVVDGVGMGGEKVNGLSVPIAETGSGHVYLSGRSMIFNQYGDKVRARSKDPEGELPERVTELDSSVAVPLSFADEVLGVLLLARFHGQPEFTNADLELAESFAAHAAVAIQFGRAAEARRMLAIFEDRDRIARDLHDLVIQRLFAIGLGLEGVSMQSEPKTADRLTAFTKQLDETIREIRRTIFSLQEEPDGQTSLRTEMLRCVREVTAALGFEPKVSFDGPLDSLVPDVVRPDLLATLREALSNAARHAKASAVDVDIRVDRDGTELVLSVTDDGVGPPDEPGRRSGLSNLASRAERWRGSFTFKPAPGGGAALNWTVQLPREARV
ncbi:GAF domain-containing sensor histidine kinase [Amycolatopsis sp. cg5]|uniref:GAF domain-containing sensor histidine kinase n=1 Tax=Amycolatopsis sp. cg5 TaxID=3238802 RepID=UPI0035242B97